MRSSKLLILASVALLVFGSAGFCAYELFVKPYSSFRFFHKKNHTPVPAPTPDQGGAAFDAAVALQNSGKLQEATEAWKAWLEAHPESTKQQEALVFLGKANINLLCSPTATVGKESYIVVKGDSLDRIANKKKSSAELIQWVNSLPNINLQIGQELFIPQLQMSITIDRQNKILTLRNGDSFFKNYLLLSTPPAVGDKEDLTSSVIDKIVTNNNKRVAFGDKKYTDSERTILLRSGGNIVAAPANAVAVSTAPTVTTTNGVTSSTSQTAPSPSTTSPTVAMPPGFVLSTSDMKEVFPLVNKTTPVTVH